MRATSSVHEYFQPMVHDCPSVPHADTKSAERLIDSARVYILLARHAAQNTLLAPVVRLHEQDVAKIKHYR